MAVVLLIIGAAQLIVAAVLVDPRLGLAATGLLVLLAGVDLARGERT